MLPLVLEATKTMNPAAKVFVGATAVVAYLAKSSADKEHEFRLKEIDYKSDIRSKEADYAYELRKKEIDHSTHLQLKDIEIASLKQVAEHKDLEIASLKKELSKKWF